MRLEMEGLLLLILLPSIAHAANSWLPGGKEVVLKYAKPCEFKTVITWQLKVRKVSRDVLVYDVDFTINQPFDDEHRASIAVAIKLNGAWRPNFFNYKFDNACSKIKDATPVMFSRLAASNNAPKKCPLPPGTYRVHDYQSNSDVVDMPSNIFPIGEYRVDMNITRKKIVLGCVSFYLDVVSATKKKNG